MVPDLSEVRQRAAALEAELQGIAQAKQAARDGGRDDDDEVDSSEREKQRQLRAARAELKVRAGEQAGRAPGGCATKILLCRQAGPAAGVCARGGGLRHAAHA